MDIDQRKAEVLVTKQRQGLTHCLERIAKWEKIKKDYEELKGCLLTLADRLSYEAMVPFGTQAFMPGRIVNTNEILVLLGDNWFVERSTKQAAEIAERRIAWCNKMLEGLEAEKQQFENWMKLTEEVMPEQERVEIVEEYDPEKEKEWRAKHRENVRAYRKKEAERRQSGKDDGHSEESERELTDDKIMERLAALELQEDEQEKEEDDSELEEEKDSAGASEESEQPSENKKNVRWKDQEAHRPVTITIKHSTSTLGGFSSAPTTTEGEVLLNSPSDIYNLYKVENIKPILKVKGPTYVGESEVWSKCVGVTGNFTQPYFAEQKTSVDESRLTGTSGQSSVNAFTGEVLEKTPKELLEGVASSSTKRPVSQFKKQRSIKK